MAAITLTPGIPEPHEWMSHRAQEIWRAYATVYGIAIVDMPLWSVVCESMARWEVLTQRSNELGPLVTVKGEVVTNPFLARADREQINFSKALAQIQRNQQGRCFDEDPEDETGQASPQSIEEFRTLLLDRITQQGGNARGLESGGDADRPRSTRKPKPKAKAASTDAADGPVRKKEVEGSQTTTRQKPGKP